MHPFFKLNQNNSQISNKKQELSDSLTCQIQKQDTPFLNEKGNQLKMSECTAALRIKLINCNGRNRLEYGNNLLSMTNFHGNRKQSQLKTHRPSYERNLSYVFITKGKGSTSKRSSKIL